MAIYALSDLHLADSTDAALFRDERQGRQLAELCLRIARDPDPRVVLLGDIFDLTSMLPPPRGLGRFARRMHIELQDAERPLTRLCEAIAETNPFAVRALAALGERVPITWVPGNHDWPLRTPEAHEALARIGLGRVELAGRVEYARDGLVAVFVHGHRWDRANAHPLGPGEILTRVIHRALIPFLREHGSREFVRHDLSRVATLRPEERFLPLLRRWLEPKDFHRLFHALVELLLENLPGGRWFEPFHWLITPERIHRRIERQKPLWDATADHAFVLLGDKPRRRGLPRPDVLVVGHTHVPDWALRDSPAGPRLYVNLGTWTERTQDVASLPDVSLPYVTVASEPGRMEARLWDLERDVELQRFDRRSARAASRRGPSAWTDRPLGPSTAGWPR